MSFVEKGIFLDLFIQNNIAPKHGSEAWDAYEGIMCTMCNNDSVEWSTNASLSRRSLETYKKNYRPPIGNTLKKAENRNVSIQGK